jgi:hypothetical protein
MLRGRQPCTGLKSVFFSAMKSQSLAPAIARSSSKMARWAELVPSLARIASMPSLIPRNEPRTAAPFSALHIKRTFDSCRPRTRLLKSIMYSPAKLSVHTILVKRVWRNLLLGGSCLYWHNDQRTFKASQNSCKRVLARDQVLGACALRAQENVVRSALGRLLEELVREESCDDGGSDFNAGTLEWFGKGV